MNIRSGEKDQGSRAGDDGDDGQGQGNLEGNTTLVEVAAMSVRALLQPPEGVSCSPVPAEPAVKSRLNNRGKQLGGQVKKHGNQPVGLVEVLGHVDVDLLTVHLRQDRRRWVKT